MEHPAMVQSCGTRRVWERMWGTAETPRTSVPFLQHKPLSVIRGVLYGEYRRQ